MRSMKEYWSAIFGQLANIGERDDLLVRLKTARLPAEVEKDQIAKLKVTKAIDNDILELPKGGFISRFKAGDKLFIALHSPGLSQSEVSDLEEIFLQYDVMPELLDESAFMFIALEYRNLLKLRKEYLDLSASRAILDIANEDSYVGHQIDDLVNYFEDILIYSVGGKSILANCSKWFLGALLVTKLKSYRAETFPEKLANKLNEILLLRNANPENIYYAATSIHARQCFMEIYRCIEGIYYLPWINTLKNSLSITGSGRIIANQLKSDLRWRQKEGDSLSRIFLLTSEAIVRDEHLKLVKAFSDLDIDTAGPDVIGRRFYKIRNILVHQEDYEDTTPISISTQCWPILNILLANIVFDLFGRFSGDLDFSYEIEFVA